MHTVHGSVFLVKEPLFRGHSSGMMCMADMSGQEFIVDEADFRVFIEKNVFRVIDNIKLNILLVNLGLNDNVYNSSWNYYNFFWIILI